MHKIEWIWEDPEHFSAHENDFAIPLDEILALVEKRILADYLPGAEETLLIHEDYDMGFVCGSSGLIDTLPDTTDDQRDNQPIESFWAYRKQRHIPSHLAFGKKQPTQWICLWGKLVGGKFFIHTVYPGKKAPREIHDPLLTLSEMNEAVAFWNRYAIIIEKGNYSLEPYTA